MKPKYMFLGILIGLVLCGVVVWNDLSKKDNLQQTEHTQSSNDTQASNDTQSTEDMKDDSVEESGKASLEEFFTHAFKPIGSTMYVWGGGWNEEDTGAGVGATYIGVYPKWKEFAATQSSTYDYKNHMYEIENGLDCSGYVGWVLYNTFETKSGKEGYVTKARDMANSLAERGWGKLVLNPVKFMPGDIVSTNKHVWICLGTCSDGSVLLVHASAPGVSVCGTVAPGESDEKKDSEAIRLATTFMKEHYPQWHEKYPNRQASSANLDANALLRWSDSTMKDATAFQEMSPEEVLQKIIKK